MVYRVLADGIDIFGSDTESSLLSPSLEMELNSAGSLEFTLPPDHPSYDDISLMQTEIDVYEDDDLIFFGRPAEVGIDWNKQKKVVCEGALAYLNDAAIRPHKFEGALISDVFKYIIAQYNAQVAQNKQFIVGNITITDRYVYTEFDYDICLSVLISTCIDSTGGYLFLRKEDAGIYIDWLAEVPDVSDQPVQFASNMLDLNQDTRAEDICTVVLPVGGQVDGVNITIASVNQGSDILEDSDAIAKYGRILKIQQWNDIIDPQALKDKATEWLAKQQEDDITIETDAAELHYLDGSVGAYRIGQLVNVISGPHGVDKEYPILKMSMSLDSGTKKITLGTPPRKELTELSGITNSTGGGSSSGGGGGGGSSDGVRDVLVNGSSVVSDHVARVSAVTAQQLADGLALKADEDDFEALQTTVAGKASQADLNALSTAVAGKASQADLNALSTTVAGKQDQLTPGAGINIDANNVISATGGGGTEVEANPSETATDDLNTIKIGDTVYDIPGGGSNTNYGKFKCDVLFVNTNGSLPGTSSALFATLSKSISEYDALFIETSLYYTDGFHQAKPLIIFKNDFNFANSDENQFVQDFSAGSSDYRLFIRLYDETHIYAYRTISGAGGAAMTIAKVYGLKFENKLINRSDIYSEEERMIGRWTDGKPLYQKSWDFGSNVSISSGNYYTGFNIDSSNIDKIIFGEIANNDGTLYDNASYDPTRNNHTLLGIKPDNNCNVRYLTLQYTKTTDQPGSGVIPEDPQMVMMSDYYSEEEQVVGRWTDGKPVYQKVVDCGYGPNSSAKDVNLTALNIDNCIQIGGYMCHNATSFLPIPRVSDRYIADQLAFSYNNSTKMLVITCRDRDMTNMRIMAILKYTKTTDAPGTGPTKGNLIYLPALYSEEEREVGVWTDGKPIYQKTMTYDFTSSVNDWTLFDDSVSYEKMVAVIPIMTAINSSEDQVMQYGDSETTPRWCIKNDHKMYYYLNNARRKGVITLQYTKTTDQPGSGTWTPEGQLAHHYSTSEKIVGTWIDGSTVYERTQNGGISISANDTWYDTIFTGVNKVISFNCSLLRDGEEIGSEFNSGYIDYVVRNNIVKIKGYGFSLTDNFTLDKLTIQYTKSS